MFLRAEENGDVYTVPPTPLPLPNHLDPFLFSQEEWLATRQWHDDVMFVECEAKQSDEVRTTVAADRCVF